MTFLGGRLAARAILSRMASTVQSIIYLIFYTAGREASYHFYAYVVDQYIIKTKSQECLEVEMY